MYSRADYHLSSESENDSEDIFFIVHRGKSEHISATAKDKLTFSAPKISHEAKKDLCRLRAGHIPLLKVFLLVAHLVHVSAPAG